MATSPTSDARRVNGDRDLSAGRAGNVCRRKLQEIESARPGGDPVVSHLTCHDAARRRFRLGRSPLARSAPDARYDAKRPNLRHFRQAWGTDAPGRGVDPLTQAAASNRRPARPGGAPPLCLHLIGARSPRSRVPRSHNTRRIGKLCNSASSTDAGGTARPHNAVPTDDLVPPARR
jgi:hypothetical protein